MDEPFYPTTADSRIEKKIDKNLEIAMHIGHIALQTQRVQDKMN